MSFFPQIPIFFVVLSAAAIRAQLNDQSQILTYCRPSWDNFTSDSQFDTNLKTILPSLAAKAVRSPDGYYNATLGADPDRIYGFAQCMSAAAAAACEACFKRSIPDLGRHCANKKRATIRYDSCILRYSDKRFFSLSNRGPPEYIPGGNVPDPTNFNKLLSGLLRNLRSEAAAGASRAAWGRTKFDDFSDLFGLVQCTRDLGSGDCSDCLDAAISYISSCCLNRTLVGVYYPSCSIRYDIAPFDPASRVAAPPVGAASPPPSLPSPPPPSAPPGPDSGKSNSRTVIIALNSGVSVALAAAFIIYICILRRKKKWIKPHDEEIRSSESLLFDLETSLLFDLETLRTATNDFSISNKLGQGGFGPVYKGTLPDGQEIAVKRLLTGSSQGSMEFRNEVAVVAKLQHRNLVRLLGCCLENREKLLVYEYVPNTSLDKFLFDPARSVQLGWDARYRIIVGIARGLLYLHEDSRLRIIHRDLKASNILLDSDMNPKISDFGLAKIFGGDQSMAETGRIAGTYGYMSPEYAMRGLFSVKSDVFSFGVLMLEIVTGRRNSGFDTSGRSIGLLDYTWKHWNEGKAMNLVDRAVGEAYRRNEVLRYIHLGLLCVQEDSMERPIMSTVVLMLSSHSVTLPRPSPPAFCVGRSAAGVDSLSRNSDAGSKQSQESSNKTLSNSINKVSITELHPR